MFGWSWVFLQFIRKASADHVSRIYSVLCTFYPHDLQTDAPPPGHGWCYAIEGSKHCTTKLGLGYMDEQRERSAFGKGQNLQQNKILSPQLWPLIHRNNKTRVTVEVVVVVVRWWWHSSVRGEVGIINSTVADAPHDPIMMWSDRCSLVIGTQWWYLSKDMCFEGDPH